MSGRSEAYYPGCSGRTTDRAYVETSLFVLRKLGLNPRLLEELPCCGTLEGELYSRELVRRLVSLINREAGGRVITGCSGCYSTINRNGGIAIHLVDFLVREVGLEEISSRVVRRLNARVAPYYGCLALRPRSLSIDDPEDPSVLESLLSLTGADPVDFPMRTKCCGGPLVLREPDAAVRMARSVVTSAKSSGAGVMATMCNLCHFMLDFYTSELPVVHFTQLLAYSMGMPVEELGLGELFNPPPLRMFGK
ncbi:MAG: heterodisulfide reductase-related iron-sulfur binding cluster [Candidatus Korarchaeum sp.]